MSTVPMPRLVESNGYPTTDPKYTSESELHRLLRNDLIESLQAYYLDEPLIHVTGDLLLFYEEGDRRVHLAPDLFVAFGVDKRVRDNYLMWEEVPPSVVLELTSPSTRDDDVGSKFALYQDVLKVKEYFLFDPKETLISPSMQGWRLVQGKYRPIREVAGRLPSKELGLHLERDGRILRLWNPETNTWLPTTQERIDDAERARDSAQQARDVAQQQLAAALEELRQLKKIPPATP